MRIFKYRTFRQWAKSEGITDKILKNVVTEMEKGLFEASLGSNLYKKRLAKNGKGKRGGYRVIITFKQHDRTIFMYGYAKNECDNLNAREELVYKKLAKYFLELTDTKLELLIKNGELFEVIL